MGQFAVELEEALRLLAIYSPERVRIWRTVVRELIEMALVMGPPLTPSLPTGLEHCSQEKLAGATVACTLPKGQAARQRQALVQTEAVPVAQACSHVAETEACALMAYAVEALVPFSRRARSRAVPESQRCES